MKRFNLPAGWPTPTPDAGRFAAMLRRQPLERVPLVELAIADEVLGAIAGEPLPPWPHRPDPAAARAWADARVQIWRVLGYDYYRCRAEIPFAMHTQDAADDRAAAGTRTWVDEHQGVIRTADDVERYPWPTQATIDFGPTEAVLDGLPEGMGVIGFSGGVLEWTSNLLGLEGMMLMLYDAPEVVRAVVDRVGQIILEAFEVFCQMDAVFAIWLGDDMGFRTATLLRPEHLRAYILPWHRRYAELAHRTGRLFMLHSCGQIEAVMPDLIEQVSIDAKHSFEDAIEPVERVYARWGRRIAILGGVDVDLLARRPVEEIRARTGQILEACGPGGGYAAGSGNSIPNYIPPAAFLAMLETVHRFNGRRSGATSP